MIEKHYKITAAAELAGVSVDTIMRWLERSDFTFTRGARGRGKATVIPESVLQRIIESHSIKISSYR